MDAMRTQKERGLGCGHGRSQQMRVIIIETVLMPRHGPRLSPLPPISSLFVFLESVSMASNPPYSVGHGRRLF